MAEAPLEIVDGDRGINYPKQNDFASNGHCLFLSTGNVTSTGFNFLDCSFISKDKDEALRKGKLKRDDIVLTTRGTVGNVAFYDRSIPFDHIRINSGMVLLRSDSSKLSPRFLYQFVRSRMFRDRVAALSTGSAQPQLPIRDIKQIELPLPTLPEQHAISSILGSLDDKIELNRKMNETLEAMAQALFKSWFVDFDGVAPEDMRESEMGLIPKACRVGQLRDVCTVIGGFAFKSEDFSTDGHPVVKIKNISNSLDVDLMDVDYVSKEIASKVQKFHLDDGSLVMAMTGATVGKFGLVLNRSKLIPVLNQRVALLKPKEDGIGFLLSALLTTNIYDQVVLRAQGSAQPNISADGIMDSELIIPAKETQMTFSKITNLLFKRWIVNKRESLILEETRDTLLPKLVSGQLRIKDAEKILGNIA